MSSTTRREFLLAGGLGAVGAVFGKPIRGCMGAGNFTPSENRPYSASDYVQDGLVCQFDGKENAGFGIHDPQNTIWTALVGGVDAIRQGGTISWSDDACVFHSPLFFKVNSVFGKPQIVTIEVCHQAVPASGSRYGALFSCLEAGGIGIQQNVNYQYWYAQVGAVPSGYTAGVRIAAENAFQTLSYVVGTNYASLYRDGTIYQTMQKSDGIRYNYGYYQIGRDVGDSGNIVGKIFSIRLYNRDLTDMELKFNHMIDMARFGA